ncbi:claspin isoform X2 [Carcharodon carcharias]|uniref:claspin isoform X2 n=1 Tax=Carcharodon carcharias TaxID=13397 RepID=UPI001B7F0D38|nr:claspin isoform X2 [Carcharodon carcharias]
MSVSETQPRTELTFEEKTNDSDSDSGKGSCGMVSPRLNEEVCHSDRDSEEEIFTCKKTTKKPVQESDSDGEASNVNKISNLKSNDESENEEQNLNINAVDKSKKLRRVRRATLDSDESDLEVLNSKDQTRLLKSNFIGSEIEKPSTTETHHKSFGSDSSSLSQEKSKCSKYRKERENRKDRSQRQREKAQKKLEVVEKLKRKKKKQEKQEESTEFKLADDSGCLLNNSDLFETEVDDEHELGTEEEELSLDAIRAAVKNKAKQSKSTILVPSTENLQDYDCEEALMPLEEKKVRTERKAAKQSKEAIRQIHSETQRLMREANLSLPYHLPQPKTIHDFFKKRPRPACQGSAMSLLKSSKYQPCLLQETSDSTTEIEILSTVPQEHGLLDQLALNNENVATTEIPEIEEPDLNNSNNKENTCPNPPESEIQVEKKKVEIIEQSDISTDLESKEKSSVNAEPSMEHDHYSFCLELAEETGSSDRLTTMHENPHVELGKAVPDAVVKLSNDVPSVTEEEQKQLEATSMVKQRKSKLDKLRVLGVDLTLKPRLCADEGAFVNLEEPKENKELQALKERFLKHSIKPVKQNQERHVELNIIRKTYADGKEELKADSVAVTLGKKEVEEFGATKPGEKLQALKAKLQEAMKLRRIEERQKRQALYKLDNEQGFENEEDEEEELTESEEDDPETVEFLLGDGEEAGVEADDDTQSTDTAQNQDLVTQQESTPTPKAIASECSQSLKPGTASSFKFGEQTSGNKLRLQLQQTPSKGDSKLDEDDSTSQASTAKENSHNSSFELIGSMITSYQPCNKQPGRFGAAMLGGFRSPSPNIFNPNSQFKTSFVSSASKSSGKLSEPSMPVEDSQDLYNTSPEPKNSTGESQFRFSLEDETQSQLLDADGFLNVGHRSNKWQLSKRQLLLDNMDENAMDANMGELLGFCSGEFKSQNLDTLKEKNKEKEQNIDELLGLCSGKFVSPESSCSISSAAKQQKTMTTASDDLMTEVLALCSGSFPTDKEDDEENEDDQFQLLTDDEVFESENEESGEEQDGEKEEDEEVQLAREVLMKRKLKLKDFVEDEAELSGSEVASDDEYDAESDDYEEDVIEEDLPSDEELQEQVNKIHMKVLMDEDKRQLRLYQEQYLADGDLHSDGPGRARKFRWKNIDDSSQTDLFHGESEDEPDEDEVDESEVKWRKDRFEREQWLREQSQDAGSEEEVGEDSQFMKLAKKITVKTLQKGSSVEVVPERKQQESMGLKPQKSSSVLLIKNGSLLNRPREVLQKLAAMSDVNLNAPRANSRNFVFHTLSPEKDERKTTESKLQTKRKATATPTTSLAKRPRTEKTPTNSTHTRSIFRYLEK